MKTINKTLGLAYGAGLIGLLAGAPAMAQTAPAAAAAEVAASNAIQGVETVALQGGRLALRLKLKQPLASPPAGFSIANPARIALDFPDTANATGKGGASVNEGALRGYNLVQSGNRTRLVLNLSAPVGYQAKLDGNDVLIELESGAASAATTVTTQFSEARPGTVKHGVRGIDFRRGRDGEGRLVIELSDTTTGIDIRQQGRNLLVDLIDANLPKNLERRLDVVDFATPVQTVDAYQQGDNVRLVIEPKGLWEYSAYQTDRQFIVDIKTLVEDPNKLGGKAGYTGERLSLNFQSIDVRAVLSVIADFTGMNIVASDSVTGSLTLRLKDVPWDQALDIILQSKGLSMRKSGNVIRIAPTDELATKEKLELEARQQISDLEPVRTEVVQLRYHKADAFVKLLTDPNQKILSKRGSAVIDPRSNMLFIKDTPDVLEEVRKLVATVDVPVRQVMIESRIVEANDNFAKSLGARLGTVDRKQVEGPGGVQILTGAKAEVPNFLLGQTSTDPLFPATYHVSLPSTGAAGNNNPGLFSLVLFNSAATRFLTLELSALQVDGKGKVISSPRVVTADNVEAVIEQGTEIPYLVASSSGATSVAFKKAVLSLKVKPQITPDDNVIMDLKVNKDSRGSDTIAGPAIDTKQVTTNVLVENGGTVVIGGIYQQDERETVTKVPVLGDIPVVGLFFRNTSKRDDKTELLIFVTPKILKDGALR